MKERLARIIARECSGAESIWKTKLRVVDMLIDEIHEMPTPEGDPIFGSTDLIFKAWIKAIK